MDNKTIEMLEKFADSYPDTFSSIVDDVDHVLQCDEAMKKSKSLDVCDDCDGCDTVEDPKFLAMILDDIRHVGSDLVSMADYKVEDGDLLVKYDIDGFMRNLVYASKRINLNYEALENI